MVTSRAWPAQIVAMADPELLANRAQELNLTVRIQSPSSTPRAHQPGSLQVHPVSLRESARSGTLATANASYVLESLTKAVDGCLGHGFSLRYGWTGLLADLRRKGIGQAT